MAAGSKRPPVVHFLGAADAVADLLVQVPEHRWARTGLGEWDVRGLAGHTVRAVTTLLTSIATPAAQLELRCAADYYTVIAEVDSTQDLNEAILARGIEAGAALGTDPGARAREWVEAARVALEGADLAAAVTTAAGSMRLLDYLPTRTLELVVHGMDLAAATGIEMRVPRDALRSAVLLAADVAVEAGHGRDLLLALTGRRQLPAEVSVVP